MPNVRIDKVIHRKDLIYPELSYQIVGVLFSVHTELGNRFREAHYQKAVSAVLRTTGISFVEQVPISLRLNNDQLIKFFADFLIEDKIILEIKAIPRLTPREYQQADMYLKGLNKELAILANFRPRQLIFKRILNPGFGNSV